MHIGLNGLDRTLDVGKINGERFAVMAGAGLDAHMIQEADGALKDRFGRLAYIWTASKSLRKKPFGTRIEINGELWYKGTASCVLLGNVGSLFGGVEAFDNAKPDDGLLEVGVTNAEGVGQWARTVARTAIGKTSKSPFVQVTKAKQIRVELDRKVAYRDNFLRTSAHVLDGADMDGTVVRLADGRSVRTEAHPVSTDVGDFARRARPPAVDRHLAGLRIQFAKRRVLLGVDRLDYTKGIAERLGAIELLLELRPELRAEIAFVQVAVPSRGEIREYRELRALVEQLVGRINGRFTEPGMDVPVHDLYRGVTSERLLAYYRLADVGIVTPLQDGMNLVAKEYVTVQAATGGLGAPVLSEFAGAVEELPEALPCNVYAWLEQELSGSLPMVRPPAPVGSHAVVGEVAVGRTVTVWTVVDRGTKRPTRRADGSDHKPEGCHDRTASKR